MNTAKGSEKQSLESLIGGDCSNFEISVEVQQKNRRIERDVLCRIDGGNGNECQVIFVIVKYL